jgi:toxin ParE1/3/4
VRLIWSRRAVADLRELRAFIEQDAPGAARRTTERIIETIESMIPANPQIGRAGRVPGARELVLGGTPYIVPYRIRDGHVVVLRVLHGARRWTGEF